MSDDQKIFKWLDPDGCWHEVVAVGHASFGCKLCGKPEDWSYREALDNPDYTSEAGFFLLLKGLTKRGYIVGTESHTAEHWANLEISVDAYSEPRQVARATADSLPAALCAAVLKLIEAEETGKEQG